MSNPDRKYRDNSGREYKTAPVDTHHHIRSPPPPVEIKIEKMDGDDPIVVKVVPSPPTNSATTATSSSSRTRKKTTPDLVVIGVKPSPPTAKQPVKNKKKLQSKKSKERAERRINREKTKRKLEFESEVASNATEVTSNKKSNKKTDKEEAAKKLKDTTMTTVARGKSDTCFYCNCNEKSCHDEVFGKLVTEMVVEYVKKDVNMATLAGVEMAFINSYSHLLINSEEGNTLKLNNRFGIYPPPCMYKGTYIACVDHFAHAVFKAATRKSDFEGDSIFYAAELPTNSSKVDDNGDKKMAAV